MATLYRNADDTRRYVVHQRLGGEWDVDTWTGLNECSIFSNEAGDAFRTKAEAKAWAVATEGGPLVSLSARTHPDYTSGWAK
jgi:hypothetical protein